MCIRDSRRPDDNLFGEKGKDEKTWKAQENEIQSYIDLMEGDDNDRVYCQEEENKKFN